MVVTTLVLSGAIIAFSLMIVIIFWSRPITRWVEILVIAAAVGNAIIPFARILRLRELIRRHSATDNASELSKDTFRADLNIALRVSLDLAFYSMVSVIALLSLVLFLLLHRQSSGPL